MKMGPRNKRHRPFGSFKLGSHGIESELHYSVACMQCKLNSIVNHLYEENPFL